MSPLLGALRSGLAGLASYLAAHVLLCLVPAFFIAGALAALVPKGSIVRLLGPGASKFVAYPAAAAAGSLIAVCSCTVLPLFAGIYSKGAGLGPAVTFLFFAPAGNILALSYTGVALGADFASARIALSLVFGIGIGLLMALIFHREEEARVGDPSAFAEDGSFSGSTLGLLAALIALLLAGTLKFEPLTRTLARLELPVPGVVELQAALTRWVPVDALKGEEGLSLQGAVLILLLALIGAAGIRGLGKADEGLGRLTGMALGLTAATLVFGACRVEPTPAGVGVAFTGRSLAISILLALIAVLARRLEEWDLQQWLWETWRFVRDIFPLLVAGVFAVGVIRYFIRPEWVQGIAGSNTLGGNLAGVLFGVFMYFPTLVEVPVAKMFLSLGMHPGPLLAYLMADPELSLQSILILSTIIGKARTWTYVGLVALFSMVSGLSYGAWSDGVPGYRIGLGLAALVALPAGTLALVESRRISLAPVPTGGPT